MHLSFTWRLFFIAGGLIVLWGVIPGNIAAPFEIGQGGYSVVSVLSGIACWTAGIWLFRRDNPSSLVIDRWLIFALVASLVQLLDLALIALSPASQSAALTGIPFTWITAVANPLYATAMIGLIWLAQREHILGSKWIGWLGMIGVAGHGLAGILVAGAQLSWAMPLFYLICALATWFILAGVWALRRNRTSQYA